MLFGPSVNLNGLRDRIVSHCQDTDRMAPGRHSPDFESALLVCLPTELGPKYEHIGIRDGQAHRAQLASNGSR